MASSSHGGASLPSGPDATNRRVTYFYDPDIGTYYYGKGHPMKPQRIRMAHSLIVNYGLDRRMEILHPFPAGPNVLKRYHSDDYVDFLSTITPYAPRDNKFTYTLRTFNVGYKNDCPIFHGLFDFCKSSVGGSIGAAVKLNMKEADIAVNWAGGLHHAKRSWASGFCYTNDIVLGILELLKVHTRVLYVDIDVHHGDGVEEAFYITDRVMTVSFHKFGNFFPGTGHVEDIGAGQGKYYSLNVPLQDGIDDESFRGLFRPIIQKVMEMYQPDAVVLQCGADSLAGDRLGRFNLTVKGHADCLHFLRSFNVPLMILGGGGYTLRNVPRCWCYETAVAVGVELDSKLPENDYFYDYYGPFFTLEIEQMLFENKNSSSDLEKLRNGLLEQISRLAHAPSVQFQTVPPVMPVPKKEEEDWDIKPKIPICSGAPYESDDEKPQHRTLNTDGQSSSNVNTRFIPGKVKEEKTTDP
ncbi:unnamed protein product [Ilex paraguariensis]|uniref:Histone deacetylase n=1 Tax=Ilex paraguariensis TaxID=185542 RepID=A0ABC8RBB8_9AQUA